VTEFRRAESSPQFECQNLIATCPHLAGESSLFGVPPTVYFVDRCLARRLKELEQTQSFCATKHPRAGSSSLPRASSFSPRATAAPPGQRSSHSTPSRTQNTRHFPSEAPPFTCIRRKHRGELESAINTQPSSSAKHPPIPSSRITLTTSTTSPEHHPSLSSSTFAAPREIAAGSSSPRPLHVDKPHGALSSSASTAVRTS